MATGSFVLRALAFWVVLAICGVANGFLRQLILTPALGERISRPLSGLTLIVLLYLATFLFLRLTGPAEHASAYWIAGLLWVVLTVAFEIVLGTGMRMPFGELLAAYDPRTGNLWLIDVLAILLALPLLARVAFR